MGLIVNPVSNLITRPGDTNAYTSGDLVANNTSAGSVTPFSWSTTWFNIRVKRATLYRNQATITNAAFRLHLFASSPSVDNGDNSAFSPSVGPTAVTDLGFIDLPAAAAFASAAYGFNMGTALSNTVAASYDIGAALAAATLYGLLEARAAYTPASAETFRITLEIEQAG